MNSAREFSRTEIEASEWIVLMSDRSVSLDDRLRFEAWLAADAMHAKVYQVQKRAWSAIAGMSHLAEESNLPSDRLVTAAAKRPGMTRLHLAVAASFIVMLIAGLFFYVRQGAQQFATQTAQIKDVTLEDGTVVTLGASSRIRIAFTNSKRLVTLTGGEAFFEVARDTARPFVVSAGDTQVQVLGTKFDVHYGKDAVRVSVLEGRVQVRHVATPQILTAGDSVVAPLAKRIVAVTRVDEPDIGVWRSGRLVYVNARLADVIADVNRYFPGKVELADSAAGNLQLTASFRADQIDRMLEILTTALPVDAARDGDAHIVISARQR